MNRLVTTWFSRTARTVAFPTCKRRRSLGTVTRVSLLVYETWRWAEQQARRRLRSCLFLPVVRNKQLSNYSESIRPPDSLFYHCRAWL